MPSHKGRDFLFKIGDGEESESFATLGAARIVSLSIDNQPLDATAMDSDGMQQLDADGGVQSMVVRLDGLFKDSAAEALLRTAAFDRSAANYRMIFPNGDQYNAAFVVESYTRGGSYDGLESFTATLRRSGAGSYTPAGA